MSNSEFWRLEHLSDRQLLDSLGQVLRRHRRELAELIAHLAEVEERRLHLEAAFGSLFDYCVRQLGMSEDEACRRIDLARLARRFPALFPLLASGDVTLSAALVLKPVLTVDNHLELIEAARHKSIRETREMMAARFPSGDVASSIRKLPAANGASVATPQPEPVAPLFAAVSVALALPTAEPPERPASVSAPEDDVSEQPLVTRSMPAISRSTSAHHRIDPVAAERYKLQLTIDAATKKQLETARELLRHANPGGDLAPILSRALDLLVADLLRQRFGAGARRKTQRSASCIAAAETPSTPPSASARVPNATRRAVLDRDGLSCTWVDADGNRCNSRAWLELDHRHPRGKGGSSDAENLRVLCRAHNQLAAERAYGRGHIERARTARRHASRPLSCSDPCDRQVREL